MTQKIRHITLQHSQSTFQDEITRGMANAFRTKTVLIWVTFGEQILLDIQDILRSVKVLEPFQELHYLLDNETTVIKDFCKSWSYPFKFLQEVTMDNQSVDELLDMIKDSVGHDCDSLKHNPIHCGANKSGTIVFIGSAAALCDMPTLALYCASKWALTGA